MPSFRNTFSSVNAFFTLQNLFLFPSSLCNWIKQLPYSELITGNYAEEYPY